MRINPKDPTLVSLIGEFLKIYLPCVRHRDEDTIDSYRHSINLFLAYLAETSGLSLMTVQSSDFSQKNILAFMGWLSSRRGYVATTINHRLSDIRGLCKFLAKKKAISEIDYEEIREINDVMDDRAIDFTWLSLDDVRNILDRLATGRDSIRNRFLFSLLYESGARINEVLSLRVKDLKPAGKGEVDVHFYGKGNKHRITPLSSEIWTQFTNYANKYLPDRDPEAMVFFTRRNGKRNKMSSDNVSRILADCEAAVREVNPALIHLHSHLFRRTRAMHLYLAGVPLPTISEWLGHSNIESTRFYAKVTEEMKRDALHKLGESDKSVFKEDVAFKYADNEEMLRRLCGLK